MQHMGFYVGGGGGFGAEGSDFTFNKALQSQFNPNYGMDQFFNRLSNTTGNTGIGGLTPAEQEYLRTGGYLRA